MVDNSDKAGEVILQIMVVCARRQFSKKCPVTICTGGFLQLSLDPFGAQLLTHAKMMIMNYTPDLLHFWEVEK